MTHPPEPFRLFAERMALAEENEAIQYARAATLSTVDGDRGRSSVDARIVLMHAFDDGAFLFGTDVRSRKAQQLRSNPEAALTFHWQPLEEQVRIRGHVEPGSERESDLTFDDRPRESRITAWASQQSREVSSRDVLQARFEEARARFGPSQGIPRPDSWRAFRLIPREIEFWSARRFRLHDRKRYELLPSGDWQRVVLEP